MKKTKNISNPGWAEIINAVTTPLGFFALVVLALEVVLTIGVGSIKDPWRIYLIGSTIVLLFTLVVIVAFLAYKCSDALLGSAEDKSHGEPAQKGQKNDLLSSTEERKRVAWTDIEDAAVRLCDHVLGSGFEPDTIVGVGRGGAIAVGVVAAWFRQHQGLEHRLHPVQMLDRRYLRQNNHDKKTVVIGLHTLDAQNRKVLLLNADTYTGTTIQEARDTIQRLRPTKVKTGALYVVKKNGAETTYDPDYCGKILKGQDAEISLPWRGKHYKFEEEIDTAEVAQRTLVLIHGHVGTGKTSITNSIVKETGYYPIHTDEFWFRHGLRDRHKDPGVSAEHNNLMYDLCWSVIGSGRDAILDCTSRWGSFRIKMVKGFKPWGVTLIIVRCVCSEESAMRRIAYRKCFGPHDMGNISEYKRVKKEYNVIKEKEASQINLIDVNTDELTCKVSHCLTRDAKRVSEVCEAIKSGYLEKFKT